MSERKHVEIIAAECCPDHIHMLVAIPPHLSVSQYMGYLKSTSSLMIFDRHANLKYKYGNRHFWCRDYYVDTVGKALTPQQYRWLMAGLKTEQPKANKAVSGLNVI